MSNDKKVIKPANPVTQTKGRTVTPMVVSKPQPRPANNGGKKQ